MILRVRTTGPARGRQIWAEDLASPTILQPGAYRNICIELEIHGLAVGSVIVSVLWACPLGWK